MNVSSPRSLSAGVCLRREGSSVRTSYCYGSFCASLLSRLAMAAAFFFPALPLSAQPTQQPVGAGTIEGRVVNAASNTYLNRARVRALGTGAETFTNRSGEYRLSNLPAGETVIEVFYTGFDSQQASVTVPAAGSVRRDFELGAPSRLAAGQAEDGAVRLSAFVVAAQREYDAQAIAINEQRFAANPKNVVSTDAFGEINQGNIGEFLKHVPGVTIEVKDGNTPSGIQVRGFNSNYTNVTIDGGTIASSALANTQFHSRQFVLENASIENLSRIEVVKLPTPDIAAHSLGGSVNLVSKSAFERKDPILYWKAYLMANSEALSFDKRAGAGRVEHRTILPNFDATYIHPINDRLGVVITAGHANQFFLQEQSVPLHVWAEEGDVDEDYGSSVANPVTHEYRWSIGGNLTKRTNGSVKIDWKPWDGHLLEFTASANAFKQESTGRQLTLRVGQRPVAWGETFTHGATFTPGASGAPGGSLGASTQERHSLTRVLGLRYTFDRGPWEIEFGTNFSWSNNRSRDIGKGFFRGVGTNLRGVSRIDFDDIDNNNGEVGRVTVYNAQGTPIDPTDLSNWELTNGTGEHWETDDELNDLRLSIRRDFDVVAFPLAVEIGGARNDFWREIDYAPYQWDYVGPDGIARSGDDSLTAFRDPVYSGLSPSHGRPGQDWASPWLAYESLQQNPTHWRRTTNREGDTIRNRANRSPVIEETITAGYIMGDAKFLEHRLRFVGGVRYELTENGGLGMLQDNNAVYQRDANGDFIRDPNNPSRFLRKPEAGAPGSAEDNALRYIYRGLSHERDYDGFYPSSHFTYNIREDLLFRVGYAKTIGRPTTRDIVPTLFVAANEAWDGGGSSFPGFVTASNTSLLPWEADNYDVSLEYYMPGNGVMSVSRFYKDISNFFGTVTSVVDQALIDEYGLTERELGYQFTTRINVGDAIIKGWEFNLVQPLSVFGEWGRNISLLANYTKLDLSGSNRADFTDFIPKAGNIGVSFSIGKFSAFVKWNYRGKQLREPHDAYPGANEYIRSREQVDANVEYQLTDRLAIFAAGRNITNETNEWEVSGPVAPSWSWMQSHTRYGAQYSLGVKGTF
jgi:iron complex outermembrane recepter protein